MLKYINIDLAQVFDLPKDGKYINTLGYGDEVDVVEEKSNYIKIKTVSYRELKDGSIKPAEIFGYIKKRVESQTILVEKNKNDVLKVDFVDVQQGDGCLVETPDGKVILIDGGDNQLFARYLANRFRGSDKNNPKVIECIVITHGDADHFLGLTEIYKSRFYKSKSQNMDWKKIYIYPKRVYQNGLVKRPSKINGKRVENSKMFGETVKKDGNVIITGLVDDIRNVADKDMNKPFIEWKKALNEFAVYGDIKGKRLSKGDNDAFDFLKDENISVEVLGPILTIVNNKPGLKFLGEPAKGPGTINEKLLINIDPFKGLSPSHTINGHSLVLKMKYGNANFLFAGDLNKEAELILTQEHLSNSLNLRSEIFKVPHHGSADFSSAFLGAVNPLISVVSSGDENARKEYIHPRATLMASLGKFARTDVPVVFVTELVAFFNMVGYVQPEIHKMKDGKVVLKNGKPVAKSKKESSFFAFKRTAFGIVKIRTNGKRILVYTNSGQDKLKEAYAYEVSESGTVTTAAIVKV